MNRPISRLVASNRPFVPLGARGFCCCEGCLTAIHLETFSLSAVTGAPVPPSWSPRPCASGSNNDDRILGQGSLSLFRVGYHVEVAGPMGHLPHSGQVARPFQHYISIVKYLTWKYVSYLCFSTKSGHRGLYWAKLDNHSKVIKICGTTAAVCTNAV